MVGIGGGCSWDIVTGLKCFAAGSFGGSLVTPSERLAALPRGSGGPVGSEKIFVNTSRRYDCWDTQVGPHGMKSFWCCWMSWHRLDLAIEESRATTAGEKTQWDLMKICSWEIMLNHWISRHPNFG